MLLWSGRNSFGSDYNYKGGYRNQPSNWDEPTNVEPLVDNYNEDYYVQCYYNGQPAFRLYNSAILYMGDYVYVSALYPEHCYQGQRVNSNFNVPECAKYSNNTVYSYNFGQRDVINGVAIGYTQYDNHFLYGITTELPYFTDPAEYMAYVSAPLTQYTWHSVESISGKLGTVNLATIKDAQINDGESVTGASASNFSRLANGSNIQKLVNDVV